jgi:TonB family protein
MKLWNAHAVKATLPIALLIWSAACSIGSDTSKAKFYTTAPRLVNGAQMDSVRKRVYPKEFQSRGIGGRVEVGVYITAAAKNTQIRVTKGSGITELDSAAVKVARAMKWEPALNGTKPVGAYVKFPVVFGPRVD